MSKRSKLFDWETVRVNWIELWRRRKQVRLKTKMFRRFWSIKSIKILLVRKRVIKVRAVPITFLRLKLRGVSMFPAVTLRRLRIPIWLLKCLLNVKYIILILLFLVFLFLLSFFVFFCGLRFLCLFFRCFVVLLFLSFFRLNLDLFFLLVSFFFFFLILWFLLLVYWFLFFLLF